MNAVSELINNRRISVKDVACLAAESMLFQRTAPLSECLSKRKSTMTQNRTKMYQLFFIAVSGYSVICSPSAWALSYELIPTSVTLKIK